MSPNEGLMVAAAAQTAPPTDLDPELTDFYSRFHITPNAREFHNNQNHNDLDLCVSDSSSNIEEESKLKKFTQALRNAHITALKKEDKKKRGIYSKRSKQTQRHRKQVRAKLASKGFLPVDKYIKLKENQENQNKLTSESENTINIVQDESEEGSDASTLPKDTYTYSSVNGDSEVESKGTLPVPDIWLHLRLHTRMESEESTGDDNDSGARDYARQGTSENGTDDKERHTTHKHFEVLRQEVLAQQDISKGIPGSTLQILDDQPKLREASAQLAKEAKRGSLDVIVQSHIQSMIGLLNLYTDENLVYSWKKTLEIVAKMQQCGTNHARCIRKWVMAFLKQGNLPFHQLKWK
jgi:hypothetical protein